MVHMGRSEDRQFVGESLQTFYDVGLGDRSCRKDLAYTPLCIDCSHQPWTCVFKHAHVW